MPRSRRSPNRITDDVLTDEAGNQWRRVRTDLSRAAARRLLGDPAVRVGVHAERRALRWIAHADRERVWREEIEPAFHDGVGAAGAGAPPPPDRLPFHATLWRRRGEQMLVFDDFD